MNFNPKSLFENIGAPDRIRSWGDPVPAEKVKFENCKEVLQYLKGQSNISRQKTIWNREKINELNKSVKWRKIRYGLYHFLATILFVSSLLIFVILLSKGLTGALLIPASLLLAASCLALLRNKTGRDKGSTSFEDYLSDELSLKEKTKLANAINSLQLESDKFFWKGNYNKLFEIPVHALHAENWFLLLTGIEKDRKSVMLKDKVPTGEVLFLHSPKIITRNTRSFDIQNQRMSTAAKTKSLYNEIRKSTAKGQKLRVGKQVRLEAMSYIADNPEFWNGIRGKGHSIGHDRNSEHKKNLEKIFARASRPKSTFSNGTGHKLMYNFVDLKDRALETWLRELRDKKSG